MKIANEATPTWTLCENERKRKSVKGRTIIFLEGGVYEKFSSANNFFFNLFASAIIFSPKAPSCKQFFFTFFFYNHTLNAYHQACGTSGEGRHIAYLKLFPLSQLLQITCKQLVTSGTRPFSWQNVRHLEAIFRRICHITHITHVSVPFSTATRDFQMLAGM